MNTRRISLFYGVTILTMATLACMINIGGPAYPTPAIPISTEAVGELQSTLEASVLEGSASGEITLVITEPQLTSYIAYQLQTQTRPIIFNPQVYLQDNQIRLFCTVREGYFEATAGSILTASVDSQGQLVIELSSADFGPLPVPAGLLDIITAAIKEAYTGSLGPVATGFRLERITIANSRMSLVGRIK